MINSSFPNLLDLLDPKKSDVKLISNPKIANRKGVISQNSIFQDTCSTKSSEGQEINSFSDESKTLKVPSKIHNPKLDHKSKPRNGDWICLVCGNHNYSFREFCNRCKKQSKLNNYDQTLHVYSNSMLKNEVLKNNKMNQRFKFNFCYSLQKDDEETPKPLHNVNNQPLSTLNNYSPYLQHQAKPPIGCYTNNKTASAGFHHFDMNQNYHYSQNAHHHHPLQPSPHLNYSPYPRFVNPNPTVPDFLSHNSEYMNNTNLISPLNIPNSNSRKNTTGVNKGSINSDICDGKKINLFKSTINSKINMQVDLTKKFKEMSLSSKIEMKNNKKKSKENKNCLKKKKKKKYIPVNSSNTAQENKKLKNIEENAEKCKSPKKNIKEPIFNSTLFFDFETPKKFKKDCFLNLYSKEKDSELKSNNYSKKKYEILEFIESSDEEYQENTLLERKNNKVLFQNEKENLIWDDEFNSF